MHQQKKWSEEISAKHSLLDLNLKEVWKYRDLLYMLVKRDFVTFYKQTILGPIWFFIQPILTTLMFMVIFGMFAKLPTDNAPMFAFYLAGNVLWAYFSESLTKTATVFKDNANMMGKVYFPRLIMPISIVVSGLMKFFIQFLFFVAVILYYFSIKGSVTPNLWALLTPVLVILMAMFALGLGMIFSSLTTKYRDFMFLFTFGIQLFMYATPVIYSVEIIPEKYDNYKRLIEANPLTGIFECFRYAYLGTGTFNPNLLLYSAISISIILIIGTITFNKVQKNFMDTV